MCACQAKKAEIEKSYPSRSHGNLTNRIFALLSLFLLATALSVPEYYDCFDVLTCR